MIESLRAPGMPSHEPKDSIIGCFYFKRLAFNRLKVFQKKRLFSFFFRIRVIVEGARRTLTNLLR